MVLRIIVAAMWVGNVATRVAVVAPTTSVVPEFETDVLPILTKHGCNTGACHGSAAGRGGFRLSLYAGDPDFDYESIVRQLEGRRVNRAQPDESLLLLKPTEQISHGGGIRFDNDGESYRVMRAWIQHGSRRATRNIRRRIIVSPQTITIEHTKQPFQYKVQLPSKIAGPATTGLRTDVTRWCVVRPEDPSAFEIDEQSFTITPLRSGRHVVVIRYLNQIASVTVLIPTAPKATHVPIGSASNYIDFEVNRMLNTLRIPASSQSSAAEFHRRVRLDLTGRLPTKRQVERFLANERPDKRKRLIDALLTSPEFTEFWTFRFAQLLRIRSQPQDKNGARTFHLWLKQQIQSATPYNEIAKTLLTADGDSHKFGPPNFYRQQAGARLQAEYVSEVLLGVQMRCANCHNHPLDRWTQDDYHGLAAIFAKVRSGKVVTFNERGQVTHPRTGQPAIPRIPGKRFLQPTGDRRRELSAWITGSENPYFSRAIVNRLWQWMFGRGIVTPVDDFRATNPPTHPDLLIRLADDFIKSKFDVRHTLRVICNSDAYQRSSKSNSRNAADTEFYSRASLRPLPAEVVADAIADVTGIDNQFENEPLGSRAISLFDPNVRSATLDVLDRCSREESCAPPSFPGLSQSLQLITSPVINQKLTNPNSRIQLLIKAKTEDELVVTELYLTSLSRYPSEHELTFWKSKLHVKHDRAQTIEDLAWSLLTCREFTTNH